MIYAGSAAQVLWGDGNWIFLDIGFSNRKRSCGLLVGDGNPRCLTFAEAKTQIEKEVDRATASNLVIEAPLSVCFDRSDNPTHRSIEKEGAQTRYWYTGPGCAVMVASMYLICGLRSKKPTICLFEGFVSYKDKSAKRSNHEEDVLALRSVVRDVLKGSIIEGNRLKNNPEDKLFGAFGVVGLDIGTPAVIKPNK